MIYLIDSVGNSLSEPEYSNEVAEEHAEAEGRVGQLLAAQLQAVGLHTRLAGQTGAQRYLQGRGVGHFCVQVA